MSCFICLQDCKISKCTVCSCVAHHKCWAKYKDDLKKKNITLNCPVCKTKINEYSTRLNTKSQRKKLLIKELLNLFSVINNLSTKKQKINKAHEIFDLLYKNKNKDTNLLDSNKFSETVSLKLKELYKDGWEDANYYNKLLFNKNNFD